MKENITIIIIVVVVVVIVNKVFKKIITIRTWAK
jgi:hypothetical protein